MSNSRKLLTSILLSWVSISGFAQSDFRSQVIFKRKFDFKKVSAFAISSNGQFIAVGTQDGKVTVTDILVEGKDDVQYSFISPITGLALDATGLTLAISTGTTISVIQPGLRGDMAKSYLFDSRIRQIFLSQDGGLAAVLADGVEILETRSPNLKLLPVLPQYRYSVKFMSLRPDGTSVAIGYRDNVDIVSLNIGLKNDEKVLSSLRFDSELSAVSYGDGGILAVGLRYPPSALVLLNLSQNNPIRMASGIVVTSIQQSAEYLTYEEGASFEAGVYNVWTSKIEKVLVEKQQIKFVRLALHGALISALNADGEIIVAATPSQGVSKELLALRAKTISDFEPYVLLEQRDNAIANVSNPAKDEFETQSQFEARRNSSLSEIQKIKNEYEDKIIVAEGKHKVEQEIARKDFIRMLANTSSPVSINGSLGAYDAEQQIFSLSTGFQQDYTLRVDRESARDFRANAAGLLVLGTRQLDAGLNWIYNFTSVKASNGKFYGLIPANARIPNDKGSPNASSKGPPNLSCTVLFEDPSGNNSLDAGETAYIKVRISNSGIGDATGVKIKAKPDALSDILTTSAFIEGIPSKQERTVTIELRGSDQLKDGKSEILITYEESLGFAPDPSRIIFNTRAFLPPNLVIADIGVNEPGGNGRIENGEVVEVKVRIQNIGKGLARSVKGKFDLGPNVFKTSDHNENFTIGDLASGAYYDAAITVYTNKIATDLPIFITLNEGSRKHDVNRARLDPGKLSLNTRVQQLQEVVIVSKDNPVGEVVLAGGLSVDIEQDLPTTKQANPNAIAVVIGIKDYANADIPSVLYAKRDAQLMREYLIKVLGFDPKNILPQNSDELMTVGSMKSLLRQKLHSYLRPDGSSDVFIYYAGHGAPNTASQEAFFVPYDCDPNFVGEDNAYKMTDFYTDLSKLRARKKTVVIDACFSGQTGDGRSIIKNASSVLLKVTNPLLAEPDATIFQSSESNQVSNWYPEKKHGMFTYFFLKGLKGNADANKDGKITVDELERFINDENHNLPYISRREMQRPQKAVVYGAKESVLLELKP